MSTPSSGRERAVNYISICDTIADTYPCGLTHGLQKDAIQNSVDAKQSRTAKVEVEFNIVRNGKGTFLTITDQNTIGLTGDVKHKVENYEELQPDDHWARFESFGFTKDDVDALGARGQGKFIFLHASETYTMYYDTLRKDGVHRLGGTQATKTGCPIYPEGNAEPWEGDVAQGELRTCCELAPLKEVGTRVIICEPRKEVLDAITDGEMERAIQETWFRLLQKEKLEVTICINGRVETVGLPDICKLPKRDSEAHKVWILGKDFTNNEIDIPSGEKYKVKHFHAAYLENETVPNALQGITLVQNGMKIVSRPMDMAMAPSNINEKIIGYIEFDKELDRELRKGKNQHPNHYDLKWRSSVPRGIKKFISNQLEAFGKAKLGLGEDPRERKNRRKSNAEDLAMRQLQRYAKDLKLFGPHRSRPGKNTSIPTSPPHKEKGLSFKDFFIPNEGLRVNWGEQITFSLWTFNKTSETVQCKISLRVLHGDSEIVKLLDNKLYVLESKSSKLMRDSPFVLDIEKPQYKDVGEHRVKAVLIDAETGEEIDSLTRKFWVESDPPMQQPFELRAAKELGRRAWHADDDAMVLHYNTAHPEYLSVESDEYKQANYLFRICLEGAMCFVLTRAFDDAPDYTPLNTERIVQDDKDTIPGATYEEVMSYISEIRWKVYQQEP